MNNTVLTHVPVIIELQKRLGDALAGLKNDIAELPEGEVRGVMSWQREEAALALNKSRSYIQQLKATAERNLKTVEE